MLQHFWYAWVAPHGGYGMADATVEGFFRIRVDGVVDKVLAVFGVPRRLWGDFELSHSTNEGFCAINDVFVYGETVHGELFLGVAILVDNLHLLDDGGLAALSGALGWLAGPEGKGG